MAGILFWPLGPFLLRSAVKNHAGGEIHVWKEKCIAGGGSAFFCGAKRKGYRLTPMIEREKRKKKERRDRCGVGGEKG